ncbi:uncharacterized protein [Choristoneura fumiferana]|uniref:uncharacterized protein n=1 Tax=Choristoneura fumiferana TaxID=7141 RepID=UPI003D15A662
MFSWYRFPADPVICDRWIAIVRLSREESWWKPGKRSVICSAHFDASNLYFTKGGLKKLCKGAVPQNALFLSSTLPDNISDNNTMTAEPSTSAPVDNSNNSALAAEPSTSAPVVNYNNSAVVAAEPSTSVAVDEATVLTTGNEIRPLDDFADIDYIFDTPRKVKLKKELHKQAILQLKHARIIKTLREKSRRLKKANKNLKSIIKFLKQERFIDNDKCK